MGNHKFRLSDMMPNAWFYKLNNMRKHASSAPHYSNHHKMKDNDKKQKLQEQQQKTNPQMPSRKSYYFTRTNSTPSQDHFYLNSISHSKSSSIDSLFPDPIKTSSTSSSSSKLKYPYGLDSMVWTDGSPIERKLRLDRGLMTDSFEENVTYSLSSNNKPRNIFMDINETKQLAENIKNSEEFVNISDVKLRPIFTKLKPENAKKVKSHKTITPRYQISETERRQSVSKGIKMRKANSPRINKDLKKSISSSKKSALAESLAIVKRSKNPKEDFKKSMVEMIVEHEIRSSKDLEELLACYLSLNSDEYHDMIIRVFKQIWVQLSGCKL